MKYQCIRCLATWGDSDSDHDEYYSHGLCSPCLREGLAPIYRKRQLAEGNFDCFGKALDYCDQRACKYRDVCLIGN